jgi:HD-GYP domain-containing protein (c-di-GMP phosphodiesterase class II)
MLSITCPNEHDQLAHQALGAATQLIKAFTQIADKREVLASEDIYSYNGIKLVSTGTRLSGKFYDRLVAHKLLKPIEESLSVENALDSAKLVSLAHQEAHRLPSLAPLLGQPELLEWLQKSLYELKIPAPLALKLTLMQEERPQLFKHSLIVLVLSVVLGVRANLPPEERQALALAAVFHDIGELCVDPSVFSPEHRMDSDDRQYLFTHPITGYLMLRDFKELPEGMALGVYQHHERLDGCGYPYGLHGEQIGRIARYLAVAEFAASLLQKNGADSRISMKLRLNLSKIDHVPVGIMCALFGETRMASTQLPDNFYLMTYLAKAGKLFRDWEGFRNSLSPPVIEEIAYFTKRLDDLRMMALEPGYDQCQLEDLLPDEDGDDSDIRQELMVLLDELSWQLQDITQALERKLSDRGWSLPVSRRKDFLEWMAQVGEFTDQRSLSAPSPKQ